MQRHYIRQPHRQALRPVPFVVYGRPQQAPRDATERAINLVIWNYHLQGARKEING